MNVIEEPLPNIRKSKSPPKKNKQIYIEEMRPDQSKKEIKGTTRNSTAPPTFTVLINTWKRKIKKENKRQRSKQD